MCGVGCMYVCCWIELTGLHLHKTTLNLASAVHLCTKGGQFTFHKKAWLPRSWPICSLMSVRMEAFVLDFCNLSQNVQKGGIKEFCMFIGWFERLYCETMVICIENQQCIFCGFAMMKRRLKRKSRSQLSELYLHKQQWYLCLSLHGLLYSRWEGIAWLFGYISAMHLTAHSGKWKSPTYIENGCYRKRFYHSLLDVWWHVRVFCWCLWIPTLLSTWTRPFDQLWCLITRNKTRLLPPSDLFQLYCLLYL